MKKKTKKAIRITKHVQMNVRTGLKSGECRSDDDCRTGEVCRDGACRTKCTTRADCRPSQICRDDYCTSIF